MALCEDPCDQGHSERDLHDGAQQQLIALIAQLGVARQELTDPAADQTLARLQESVRTILDDLRALSRGIHPTVLADGGLVEAAVTQRCDGLPLAVTLTVDDGLDVVRIADEIDGAAYFVVSESLANVLKHAQGDHAAVELSRRDRFLEIEIHDNGVGFDPAAVTGTGLTALRDRVAALGGVLIVDSRPGAGARIAARVPIRVVQEGGADERPHARRGGRRSLSGA